MALTSRLTRLEARVISDRGIVLQVHWPDEFVDCPNHPGCLVEVATGKHHVGVIRLGWS